MPPRVTDKRVDRIYTVSLRLNAQQHARAGRFDLWAGQVFIPAAGLLILLALLRTRPQKAGD